MRCLYLTQLLISDNQITMKKQIKSILLISLALCANIVSSQDWHGNSRIRVINNIFSGDGETTSRNRIGLNWGGQDWGVTLTGNHTYLLNASENMEKTRIYEASLSTVLPFGLNLTGGRMALHYGDGRIIGNDNWGNNGRTHDGVVLGYKGFVEIDVGLDAGNWAGDNWEYLYLSKSVYNWNFDGAYLDDEINNTATKGFAIDYIMMDDKLDLGIDYWNQTACRNCNEDGDASLIALSLDYKVGDNTTINGGMDMFTAEDGRDWNASWGDYHQFNGAMDITSFGSYQIEEMSGSWKDMYFGLGYVIDNWNIEADFHIFSDDENNDLGGNEIDVSAKNKLNDNVSYGIGCSLYTPNEGEENQKWGYLEISISL